MNDYTLNIQFFIEMNYFFQKELGNLDFFSFFSSLAPERQKLFRKFCEFRNYSVLIWDGIMENIYPCVSLLCTKPVVPKLFWYITIFNEFEYHITKQKSVEICENLAVR